MSRKLISLFCAALWLWVLSFASVRTFAVHQRPCRTGRFCDPSLSDHTGGVVGQKCTSGFYRDWTGPKQGQCVPCRCSGLSKECDERTGKCVNCQFHSAGDHCERCQKGYHGDAANKTCRACPCPFTWNNWALACQDIGSGVVECLCKPGYAGSRCERCAFGYYGNPLVRGGSCKPCNINDRLNVCHSLTGGLEVCHKALLLDLRSNKSGLRRLLLQLQSIHRISGSISKLRSLQENISVTESLVKRFFTAEKHLDLKTEQQEEDVNTVQEDLDQLMDVALQVSSHAKEALQNGEKTKIKVENPFSDANALLASIQDLIKRPSDAVDVIALYGKDEITMMTEEARRLVAEEMNERGCAARRGRARHERKKAQTLLEKVNKMATTGTSQLTESQTTTTNSLMTSEVLLKKMADLLSGADDAVRRTQDLNLNNTSILHHVQHDHHHATLETNSLILVRGRTALQMDNITNIFSKLEGIKHVLEEDSAQLDGAKLQLLKSTDSIFHILAKAEMISEAEKHAEDLSRLATDMQQVLHEFNTTRQLSEANTFDNITTNMEDAAMVAHQSNMAATEALKDVMQGCVPVTTELTHNATLLWEGANTTHNVLRMLSQSVNIHKEVVQRQKDNAETMPFYLSRASSDLKRLQKEDMDTLIESANRAAWTANATVGHVTHRLKNIRQEILNITIVVLNDTCQAVRTLNKALPLVTAKLAHVETLRDKWPPSDNLTENIKRIKELVQETRSYLNRISLATPFSGRGHIELRSPRNIEDTKAFTAIDLLLSVEENSQKFDHSRDNNMFVFYLGSKDASGDYLGMAIRRNVLICVYKLSGVIHEVETNQITTFASSSNFDRVVFHRVYQDAEVNITANFTSQWPLHYAPKRYLSNMMSGILHLDPQHTVFYVGGYPDDFKPPPEVRYPKYRGYIKLSYINDEPLCLYNYKQAVNMEADVHALMLPRSEVSNYYEGSGYSMASVKEPHKSRRRLFKFHTKSRETNALLFYMGNNESFWCLFVARGYLVLEGQQAGGRRQVQSDDKVSLFDRDFTITVESKVTVHYEDKHISISHIHAPYKSFFIGGVPEYIRERHDITAPPLKGCMDHVTADAQIVQYDITMSVSDGCPVTQLGVRTATVHSSLSADSLFVRDHQRVSLGFRSKQKHGVILRSDSQGPDAVYLSLSDGYLVFQSANYSLMSSERYNDGRWHYLSAARSPTRLELSIDNIMQGKSAHRRLEDGIVNEAEEFRGCIANIYSRSVQSFTPMDLSSLSPTGGIALGQCSLSLPPQIGRPVVDTRPQYLNSIHTNLEPTDGQCGRQQRLDHRGYLLSQADSWLGYQLPQQDLNYRPHFSFDVKTQSTKGLLLFVEGRGSVPLLALYMANGKIKMTLGQKRVIHHKKMTNDGHWHRVECSVERSTFHLLVDGIRVTDGYLPYDEGSFLDFHGLVYLGGHPQSAYTAKGSNIPSTGMLGCIRDLKMNAQTVGDPVVGNMVSPCSEGLTETGTYFGGGYMILDDYLTVGSHFVLTFELRPQHLTGLIFHFEGYKSSFSVFLIKSTVGVTVNNGSGDISVLVTPPELCDGEYHIIKVSKHKRVIQLTVDSTSKKKAVPEVSTSNSSILDALYIGGTQQADCASVTTTPFVGCLRNVALNGRRVAFETRARVVGHVNINRCPAP
uniref:laminin subunit alpha-3 isoform X2 n=1 Tax=Doryrhamphus excisus TaxID=161450 RepID=UPI0025AE330B|nr:laminin subunit alpha-3 isoform X2 [Doryrhamphus excisus]